MSIQSSPFDNFEYYSNAELFVLKLEIQRSLQARDSVRAKKYLPTLKEAFKKGEILGGNLAMLEDRLAIAKGEPQIYGTQVGRNKETGEYFIPPILNPEKINERRKERGLDAIEEYLKIWGLEWENRKK